ELDADLALAPRFPRDDAAEHPMQIEARDGQLLVLDELGEAADHDLERLALFADRPGCVQGFAGAAALHQAGVAEDRAEAVAHLVRDARRQLPRARERRLLAQLLLDA